MVDLSVEYDFFLFSEVIFMIGLSDVDGLEVLFVCLFDFMDMGVILVWLGFGLSLIMVGIYFNGEIYYEIL